MGRKNKNITIQLNVEWKSMASGDYALGLEPCMTELDDKFAYKTIKPHEKTVFMINIAIKRNLDH